jgi:hypothetical protein
MWPMQGMMLYWNLIREREWLMKKILMALSIIFTLSGITWAAPPPEKIPMGNAPKVGPAHPRFRGNPIPGKRVRPPGHHNGPKTIFYKKIKKH